MTTLKDFIKETFTQITEAAREFSEQVGEDSVSANPQLAAGKSDTAAHGLFELHGKAGLATVVEFDVAIAPEESENGSAGGGIKVISAIRADGEIEATAINSTVSRVHFRIPLQLPAARERLSRSAGPRYRGDN